MAMNQTTLKFASITELYIDIIFITLDDVYKHPAMQVFRQSVFSGSGLLLLLIYAFNCGLYCIGTRSSVLDK